MPHPDANGHGRPGDERYHPLRDYAVIGDCHGAALVSRTGDIDWCCLGRMDANPVFCRILDADRGGFLSLRPVDGFSIDRTYLAGTNILRTRFATATGRAIVTDFMPVGRKPGNGPHNYVDVNAPGWLIRIVECEDGHVPMTVRYRPSLDFAARRATIRNMADHLVADDEHFLFHDGLTFTVDGDAASAGFNVKPGERRVLVLTQHAPGFHPAEQADRLLAISKAFWQEWIGYCRYDGPYKTAVQRSSLTLKLLIYAPTGAIAAAPTCSLPETIGGTRNWDYRYCWLRDSAFTLYALSALGYGGESRRFSALLPRVCAATFPDVTFH